MSKTIDVHEVCYGTADEWETVCLCFNSTWAGVVCLLMNKLVSGGNVKYFIKQSVITTATTISIVPR